MRSCPDTDIDPLDGYETRQVSLFHVFVRFFSLDPAQNPTKIHFFREGN